MDAVLAIGIGLMITLFATIIGYKARATIHALLPIRDPILLTILAIEILEAILYCAEIIPVAEDVEQFALICMAAFDCGYVAGFVMNRPGDVIFVDMPDETLTISKLEPLVYYYHNTDLCIMPQTLGGIITSHLGARHFADMPIHEISRRRYVSMTDGIRRIGPVSVVPIAEHTVEDCVVGLFRIGNRKTRDENRNIIAETPKYLFHVNVQHHVIRFSQSAIDDPETFWVKRDVYQDATRSAIEAKVRAARLEVLMTTAAFDAGANLVSGLVNLGTDAADAHEDILARIEAERKRRGDANDDEYTG